MSEDAFASLRHARGYQQAEQPGTTQPPPVPATRILVPVAHESEPAAARDIQIVSYLDAELDAFIEDYAAKYVQGRSRRPSRSVVAFFLMQTAMQVLTAQGKPPIPASYLKKGRKDD